MRDSEGRARCSAPASASMFAWPVDRSSSDARLDRSPSARYTAADEFDIASACLIGFAVLILCGVLLVPLYAIMQWDDP